MSNAETPAENTGGTTATSTTDALADLPDRIRVHALAKRLGTSSREVLAKLAELGQAARSPQSGLDREVALQVAEAFTAAEEGEETATGSGGDATDSVGTGSAGTGSADPVPAVPAASPEQMPPEQTPPEQTPPEQMPPEQPEQPVHTPIFAAPSPVFLPPSESAATRPEPMGSESAADRHADRSSAEDTDSVGDEGGRRRRRRGRRGRGRGRGGEDTPTEDASTEGGSAGRRTAEAPDADPADTEPQTPDTSRKAEGDKAGEAAEESPVLADDGDSDEVERPSRRRRRRRRRKTGDDGVSSASDDPPNTVVHVRDAKTEGKAEAKTDTKTEARDGVRSVRGSTRLEAKRQRRRDGREAGRRRAPILSEAEFLARRESVERTMVVAERGDSTQIGVLEDDILVEHFVTSSGSGSIVGNVYLGRVQNVLPSMEAAFIDIGRGRNAVLYAGEVDWDAAGLEGKARKIEQALTTGDSVLVQVTKDPVGHKGARLTTQISLPGRFLVYVPGGGPTGISRKLPENERRRLKDVLKRIVPDDAGVIIRTASEGIREEELGRDVHRLKAQWEVIQEKVKSASETKKGGAPVLLYEEPDLLVKVVRDLFTEDFTTLEVQGDTAWETVHAYVEHVAPELSGRLKRHVGTGDIFTEYRIDEQLAKALDRKVWLPSGGYLVIDRTEAMTVIDVNTGKFTGSGGNLEETVTRNNLESAEEIVRQLRLRDIGGIIVIDFIDMVLESNRELVLRRLTECLARDRTRHQVAEVTSLGLVQMTRKRVGTGLLDAFSTTCEHCNGRGLIVSTEPQRGAGGGQQHSSRRVRGKGKGEQQESSRTAAKTAPGVTPEQREAVASAVQVMANASKSAAQRTGDAQRSEQTAAHNGLSPASNSAEGARPVEASTEAAAEEVTDASTKDAAVAAPQRQSEPESVPASTSTGRTTRRPRRTAMRPAGPPTQDQGNA